MSDLSRRLCTHPQSVWDDSFEIFSVNNKKKKTIGHHVFFTNTPDALQFMNNRRL